MFAYSFFKPTTARDWRTFGAFTAFVVALFVEMYCVPLTINLLSGWLQTKFSSLGLLPHNSGHLWSTLLGEKGDPHFGALHIASYIFLASGFSFLLQWPTLLTLLMFPVLLIMYGRLAVTKEAEMRAQFGEAFESDVQRTPRFFPRLGKGPAAT